MASYVSSLSELQNFNYSKIIILENDFSGKALSKVIITNEALSDNGLPLFKKGHLAIFDDIRNTLEIKRRKALRETKIIQLEVAQKLNLTLDDSASSEDDTNNSSDFDWDSDL